MDLSKAPLGMNRKYKSRELPPIPNEDRPAGRPLPPSPGYHDAVPGFVFRSYFSEKVCDKISNGRSLSIFNYSVLVLFISIEGFVCLCVCVCDR